MRPVIHLHEMHSLAAGSAVEVRVLAPDEPGSARPLILVLHGAMSSAASLEFYAPLVEELWASRRLPPVVMACASTPTEGGFYIDWPGAERWETVVADELPASVAARFDVDPSVVALVGASMGGYGVLKLGFAHPERYRAAAALAPAVFAGNTTDEVPERNRPGVLGSLLAAVEALPQERVHERLAANVDAIRDRGPALFLGVGERDEFHLRDGAEHLHSRLLDLGVPHQYLVVARGDHMGQGMIELQRHALEFIGSVLART